MTIALRRFSKLAVAAGAVLLTPGIGALEARAPNVSAGSCTFADATQEIHAFGTVMARHTVTYKFCAGRTPTAEVVEHAAEKVGVFSGFTQDVDAYAPQGDPTHRQTAAANVKMCLTGPVEFLCWDFLHTFTGYATPTFPPHIHNPAWDQDLF